MTRQTHIPLSRRQVLLGAALGSAATVIPFSEWMARSARASTTMIRYSTASPEGQEMLKIYDRAVGVMQGRPASDPTSWTFQWYTHWARGDSTKEDQIAQIYASDDQYKSMAEAMLDTCQGHKPNPPQNFAAWHRAYVLFLEEIVREAAGAPAFTLPYWPYELEDQRAIPEQFRMQDSSDYGNLYIANRWADQTPTINDGGSVEIHCGVLSFNCLQETEFFNFNYILNQTPHGQVHTGVGDNQNMAQVPWAARDPVFWAHHSQVDRIWASWNAAGGQNPTDPSFLQTKYSFSRPDGTIIVVTNEDMMDSEALGYDYQTLIPTDPIVTTEAPIAVSSVDNIGHANIHLAGDPRSTGPITLGAAPVSHDVQISAGGLPGEQVLKSLVIGSASTGFKIYLRFNGMMATDSNGTAYGVYLELPDGASPSPDSPHYAGALNFFNHTHIPGMDHTEEPSTYLLNVTATVQRLQEQGLITGNISVTIAPFLPSAAGGAPVIGSIEVIWN